MDFDIPAEKL